MISHKIFCYICFYYDFPIRQAALVSYVLDTELYHTVNDTLFQLLQGTDGVLSPNPWVQVVQSNSIPL